MAYLPKAENFDDMEKKKPPYEIYPEKANIKYECPLCHGYGGWNLSLNTYAPGFHFKAACNQCNGWGWVSELDKDCVHNYRELPHSECKERGIYHYGTSCHVYKCQTCPRRYTTDSS